MKKSLILSLAFAFAVVGFSPVAFAGNHSNNNNNAGGGNEDCPAGTIELAKFNYQGNAYVLEGSNTGGVVIDPSSDDENVIWTSTTLVSKIVVKGGPDNVIEDVNPPALSGSFTNENLPTVGSGESPGISNIKFCGEKSDNGDNGDDNGDENGDDETPPVTPPVTPSSTDVDEEDQVDAPAAGVNAGSGNAATIATAAVTLIGSLASLGYGVVRFTKFGA